MIQGIQEQGQQIIEQILKSGSCIAPYVSRQTIPKPFFGHGQIRLIILGQDPTVKNEQSRKKICTVLNLDKPGSLLRYVNTICEAIGVNVDENLYATNVFKNFFIQPPTTIDPELQIFREAAFFWLPLLKRELAMFPQVPILTLGEPILDVLVGGAASRKVRDYWGFAPAWKVGQHGPFRHVTAADSSLGRPFFPFPHQPSLVKSFYKERLYDYLTYMKQTI